MNIQIREDARTLRGFYPEAERRRQVLYEFTHRFLPTYLFQSPYQFGYEYFTKLAVGRPMNNDRFIQSRWMMFEQLVGLVPQQTNWQTDGVQFRKVTELAMTLERVAKRPTMLIRGPRPENVSEAYFIAIVFETEAFDPRHWPRDLKARYIALEYSLWEPTPEDLVRGVLCEWIPGGKHNNHGAELKPDPKIFLEAVEKLIRYGESAPKPGPTPGEAPGGAGGGMGATG
jgi:hypothetical protein